MSADETPKRTRPRSTGDAEFDAIRVILGALDGLDPTGRGRVLNYVNNRVMHPPMLGRVDEPAGSDS